MFSSLRGIVHESASSATRDSAAAKLSPYCLAWLRIKKKPLGIPRGFSFRDAPPTYLAGTVTGAKASPAGSFMNWKKLELGSTTSTSPGFENEAR